MALNANASAATLSLRDVVSLAPIFANWRNSKGRLMPIHLRSAPGTGKSMIPRIIAEHMARSNPGQAVGMGVTNPGLKDPAGVAGFNLFADVDGIKTAVNTRPDIFRLAYAVVYAPDSPDADESGFVYVTTSSTGASLFPGSEISYHGAGGQLLLPRVMRGVILLDEFMQADPEVRKVLAPLLDEGRVGDHVLPPDFLLMLASNRAQDKSGVGKGLFFITNRECGLNIEVEADSLESYFEGGDVLHDVTLVMPSMEGNAVVHRMGGGKVVRDRTDVDSVWHPAIKRWFKQNIATLQAGVPDDPNAAALTARSLEAVSNLFDIMLRLPVADESGAMDAKLSFKDSYVSRDHVTSEGWYEGAERHRLFHVLASGTVGADNTTQMMATLELFGEVPTPAEVLRDPAKAMLSEKMDARFITAYQLSNAMRKDNADAFVAYMSRPKFERSLRDNAIMSAAGRDHTVMMAGSVAQFMRDNPESMARMMLSQGRAALARNKKGG